MAIRVPHNAMLTLSFSGMVQRGQTAETTNRHFPTVCSPRVNIPTYGRGHTTLKTAEIALVWHNFDSPVTSTPVRRRPATRSFLRIVHGIVSRRHIHVFGQET